VVTLTANDTPALTVPSAQTITSTAATAIGGLSVTDTSGGASLTATVSATNGNLTFTGSGITNNGTHSVTVSAANTTALNTILGTLRYTAGTAIGSDTINVTVNDNGTTLIGGAKTGSAAIAVTVANPAPTVSVPSAQSDASVGWMALSPVSVTEAFSGSTVTARVSVTNGIIDVGQGGGAAAISGNDTASITVSGSVAAVNLALATLKYQTSLSGNGVDSVVFSVKDDNSGAIGSASLAVNVVGNDTPVVTVGGAQTFSDTASHALNGISVSDQFGATSATAIVSAGHGTLTLTAASGASITNNNTGTVTVTGAEAAINSTLATLHYTATATATGTDTVTVSYDDNGTSLVGGHKSASSSIGITLVGNQAPAIATPSLQTFGDTLQHAISGISLSDDATGTSVRAVLGAGQGTLHVTASGAAAVAGNDSGGITIDGTLADIGATLASLKYTTTATATTDDSITISVTDNGTTLIGGAKTGTAAIAVRLTGNDTPAVTVPAALTIADNAQHAISGVAVADTVGGASVTAIVSAAHGTLSFTGGGVSSNGTGSVTITAASTSALNTILGTLRYTTTATATTTDTVTVSVSDNDSSGIGGAKSSANSFTINVVADAPPVVTVPQTVGAIADTTPHALSGISVSDTANSAATFTATVSTANGGSLAATGASVTGNGTATLAITDTLDNVNAALATLVYTASSGVVDPSTGTGDVVTVQVGDNNTTAVNGAQSASRTIAITLLANDTPSLAQSAPLTISDTAAHAVSGLHVSDSLGSASLYTATIADTSGTLSMTAGTGSATIGSSGTNSVSITASSIADINAALATLTYRATVTSSGDDAITLSVNDHGSDASLLGGNQTGTGSVVNVVLRGNVAPEITAPGVRTVTTAAANAIAGLSVADANTGGTVTATLTASHGTIDVTRGTGTATIGGNDSASVTVSGSLADVNAALVTLGYTTLLTTTGSDVIAVTVDDGGSNLIGGVKTATANIAVNVFANDTPVVTVAGQQTFSDTAAHLIAGVGVSDSANAASVTATLTAQHGTLTVTGAGVTGNGTGSVTVTGALADVNTILGTLQYATTATATGNDTITVSVDDNGTALIGGAKTGTGTIAVTLIGNDTPVLGLAGAQYFSDTAAHALSGVGIGDVRSGGTVTANVSDTYGTLHVDPAAGLTLSGDNSTHVTLSGSLSAVSTALGTLTYAATNSGVETIAVTIDDGNTGGIGGAKTASGSIAVTVFGNDIPVVSVGGAQTINDTAAHAIGGVSVSDVYGGASATAIVSATAGDLSVTAGNASVSNNGTGSVTISGSEADINSALATLRYASTASAGGSDTITVSYDDNGTTLLGGAKTGSATIAVTLTANDTPVVSVPTAQAVHDRALHAISGVSVTDTTSAASVTATVSAPQGTLDLSAGVGSAVIANNDSGTVTITGSLADVNAALATMKYATTASATGNDTITVSVNDNASTLIGGAKTGSSGFAVAIGNATAPVVTVSAPVSDASTDWAAVSGISVAETFAVTAPTLNATITASNGILDLGAGGGGATIGSNDSGHVTVSGSQAAINAALATLRYKTGLTASGADGIVVTVADSGTSLSGSATQDINVIANDTPVVTVAGAQTINDAQPHAIAGISVSDQFGAGTVTATVSATAGILSVTAGATTVTGGNSGTVTISGSRSAVNTALGTLQYASTANATGSDTITVNYSDNGTSLVGGAKTASATIGVTLVGNQAPAIATPASQSFGDTLQHAIAGLSLSDAATGASVTATVSDAHGLLHFTASGSASVSGNNSDSVIITGSLAEVSGTLGSLEYASNATGTTSDSITVSVNDNGTGLIGGAKTAVAAIAVTLTGNDTPVVTVPVLQTITDTNPHAISGVSVADGGSGSTLTATVTATAGTLNFTGAGVTGNGTGSVTISAASVSALNTILGTLTYTTIATGTASDTVTVAIDDGNTDAIGAAKTGSNSFAIQLTANAAPAISVPATQNVADLNAHALTGISVSDSRTGTVTATVSAASGGILNGTGFTGGGSGTLSITGTLTDVNAALATVTYTAADDGSGGASADVVTVAVDDGNTAGIGGAKNASSTIAITLVNNDTPSVAASSQLTISDTGAHAVSGLSVSDALGGTSYTATVSDTGGSLAMSAGTGAAIIGGTATSRTITAASLADLNAALATLTYTASASGDDTITVAVDDNGSTNALVGGDKTGTASIGIVLVGNDTPSLALPSRQTVTTTAGVAISGLSVADSYSGSAVTATVSASHGTLSFTGAGVSGNGTGSVTVTAADSAALNAILGTLTYATTLTNAGGDTISVSVDDGNTSGIGGAMSATGGIEVSVIGNVAPVVAVAGEQSVSDTNSHAITGVGVTDAASAASVTATLTAQHGNLTVTGAGVTGNGTGSVTITGALADVNTVLGTLNYATTATATGNDLITVSVDDNAGTLVGGAKIGSATIAVTLIGNDAPQPTMAGAQFFSDINLHAIAGVGVADSHSGANVTAIVGDTSGTLHFTPAGGLTIGANDTTNVTLSGSLSAVNTALGTLAYTAATGGRDDITVTIADGNAAGIGGAKSATGTIAVTVFGNDIPVITVPGGQTINDTLQHAITGVSALDIYGAASVTATVSAQHGILDLNRGSGAATIANNDTATVTITGALADVNTALATMKYAGTRSTPGNDTITVSFNDNGTTLVGGAKTGVATIDIVATPTIVAPLEVHSQPPPPPAPAAVEAPRPPPPAPTAEAPVLVTAIRAVAADTTAFTQGAQGGGGDAIAAKAASLNTIGSGFQVALATPSVNAVRDGSLFVQKGIPSIVADSSIITFTVPSDAFGHTSSEAGVQLVAKLTDGQPLPPWLSFDTTRGTFVGEVPPDFKGALSVIVVARDSAGHEVSTTFRIQLGGAVKEGEPAKLPANGQTGERAPAAPARHGEAIPNGKPIRLGKPSFSQQLKMASRNAARRIA